MKKIITISVLFVLATTLILNCRNEPREEPHPGETSREEAIDFTLTGIDGIERTLSEQTGKVVLVDFWATWCPPCKVEIPYLKEIYATYKDEGLVIWGVGLDDEKKLRAFVQQYDIEYPILIDDTKTVGSKYSIQGIPTTILYDKKGRIAFKHVGFAPGMEKDLENEVVLLLKE